MTPWQTQNQDWTVDKEELENKGEEEAADVQ